MEKLQHDARVTFHIVIRPIPETAAYSVTIGEIQDGQFVPTARTPQSYPCDWDYVKPNPLAPGQSYVAAPDLSLLITDLALHSDEILFYPNMLVFTNNDYPSTYEKSKEKTEEQWQSPCGSPTVG